MKNYYNDKLSAQRLKQCYEIASPRIQQYLQAEVDYILEKIDPEALVLELGCGYGRVLYPLIQKVKTVIGIDNSFASLEMAKKTLGKFSNCGLFLMDAVQLAFRDQVFGYVVCIQNGISAFHVNQQDLIEESIRVTKPGGHVLFSSYSDRFWEERLEWFRAQSDAHLLGDIDYDRTINGTIVCKDGFTATTVRPPEFLALVRNLNLQVKTDEIDNSNIFYEIAIPLF